MELEGTAFSTPPRRGFSVAIGLTRIGRISLQLSADGKVIAEAKVGLALEWDDERLYALECAPGVLEYMFSLRAAESALSASEMAFYARHVYMPRPRFGSTVDDDHEHAPLKWPYDVSSSQLVMGANASACGASCSAVSARMLLTARMAFEWTFFAFPFDRHILYMNVSVHAARLEGCGSLEASLRQREHDLLPTTNTWLLTSVDGSSHSIVVARAPTLDVCVVRVGLMRNYALFLVKNLLVLIIIVQAALLALRLNPQTHLPPRVQVTVFGMVLVALRSQQSLSDTLGPVTYLLWVDVFYLFHFAVLTLGLVETVVCHGLIRVGRCRQAHRIDAIFIVLIPFVVYPICLVGLFVWAITDNLAVACVLFGLGVTLPLALGAARVRVQQRQFLAAKQQVTAQLARVDDTELDDASDVPLLREAFALFDYDHSGTLDSRELRMVFEAMYPTATRSQRKEAMRLAMPDGEGGEVPFDRFDDAILAWRTYARAQRNRRLPQSASLVCGVSGFSRAMGLAEGRHCIGNLVTSKRHDAGLSTRSTSRRVGQRLILDR